MNKSYFCRTESYVIEGEVCPRSCYPCSFMLLSVFLSSQKGDNFRVIDRVFVGPFNIIGVSQYLWA